MEYKTLQEKSKMSIENTSNKGIIAEAVVAAFAVIIFAVVLMLLS